MTTSQSDNCQANNCKNKTEPGKRFCEAENFLFGWGKSAERIKEYSPLYWAIGLLALSGFISYFDFIVKYLKEAN